MNHLSSNYSGHTHHLASVPGFPCFDLPFAFTIKHDRWKLKRGRPGSIHHVNDVRWTRGGHREGGAQLPKQHTGPSVRALYLVFRLQTLTWWKLLILNGKKLAFKFATYIFEYQPLPTYTSRPLMWWMLPGLPRFSPVFHSHVLLWTQTKGKNGGGLGMRLHITGVGASAEMQYLGDSIQNAMYAQW